MPATISINRAPVLTLWAAVVAQRLGFRWDESLSLGKLGKALAGLNAQSNWQTHGVNSCQIPSRRFRPCVAFQ